MPFARINRGWLARVVFSLGLFASGESLLAAGVTLLTHGANGTTTGWVTGIANALSARLGGGVPIYRLSVSNGLATSISKVSGGNPLTTTNGEIIILLDWGPVSGGGTTTYQVAGAVAPLLQQTNLIAELGGHAPAEFPLHLVGHSRGGSLVCELSKVLGQSGLWVDQVTTLDAYPLGTDAPVAGYENVLFAESYYQTDYLFFDGLIIPNSHWRRQTTASGGYGDLLGNWHSDVHLWYHGTIDLAPFTSDTEATITNNMRNDWWTAVEQKGTNAGFIYSRPGGGNRLSPLQPNGVNSSPIRDGFNQRYDLGAGATNNRTLLASNSGGWPNVIQLSVLSTNPIPHGGSAELHVDWQWAVPVSQTQSVQVYLDLDRNPLNGNERFVLAGSASGTTSNQVGSGTINVPLNATNAPAGGYAVFVKMSAGGRSRVLYAAGGLTVVPGATPPWLDITGTTNGTVIVGVNGMAGQTVILQRTANLLAWQPLATNTLTAARWELLLSADGTSGFFRAVQP